MLTCPHCRKPTISFLKKIFMSPSKSYTCNECKEPYAANHFSTVGIVLLLLVFNLTKDMIIYRLYNEHYENVAYLIFFIAYCVMELVLPLRKL